jgi:hypothetical protein
MHGKLKLVLDIEGHPIRKANKKHSANLYDLIKGDIEPVKAVW